VHHLRPCSSSPQNKGRISDRFKASDSTRTDEPVDLLRADGVHVNGRVADPSQKLDAVALASLLR
jgi:hypothetical protein